MMMKGLGRQLYLATLGGQVHIVRKILDFSQFNHYVVQYTDPETGFTALHVAARDGHLKIVQQLLHYDFDIDSLSNDGLTPLMLAVINNEVAIAKVLLRYGANIHHQNEDGSSALHFAALYGNLEAIKLLAKFGANINDPSKKDGSVALHFACELGYIDIVNYLMRRGADTDVYDNMGQTPFHHAIVMDHTAVVKLMIKFDQQLVDQVDSEGFTPLHMAVSLEYYEIAQLLLETGTVYDANYVNRRSTTMSTPLIEAVISNNVDLVFLLLDYHANPLAKTLDGNTPLMLASMSDNSFVIQQVILSALTWIELELQLLYRNDDNQDIVLIAAAANSRFALSDYLKRFYLYDRDPDDRQRYVLHYICEHGNVPSLRYLLDWNRKNRLFERSMNAYDEDGYTPLCLAALHDHKDVVQLLLKEDIVDVKLPCNGRTPPQLALLESNFETALVLLEHTAKVNAAAKMAILDGKGFSYCTAKEKNCTLQLNLSSVVAAGGDWSNGEADQNESKDGPLDALRTTIFQLYSDEDIWNFENNFGSCICLNCSFDFESNGTEATGHWLNISVDKPVPAANFVKQNFTRFHVEPPGNAKDHISKESLFMLQGFAWSLFIFSCLLVFIVETKLIRK